MRLLAAVYDACARRARGRRVRALCDTTEFNLRGLAGRAAAHDADLLGILSDGAAPGLKAHVVYCVDEVTAAPVGFAHVCLFATERARVRGQARGKARERALEERESARWRDAVTAALAGPLAGAAAVTVVADAETDQCAFLAAGFPEAGAVAGPAVGYCVRIRYDRLVLGSRFGEGELPMMRAVDLRRETLEPSHWIGPTLVEAITERLGRGEQSLLFLNRRGYAPVQVCRACGHQLGCHQCDARMVEHRFRRILMCHQCGETRPMPTECPECGVEGKMAPVGPGVERLAEEVAERFPEAKVAVLSSDLYGSARQLKAEIEAIAAGAADIVIGTQLVAKGHNFPLLTLVGVIDADLGLQGSDLRAAERTFALMRQVAGRAGRVGAGGVALLQSHQPEHPVIKAILSGQEEEFWAAEATERRAIGVPPYGRMAGIVVSSPEMHEAYGLAEEMARRDEPLRKAGAELWGPAAAPIALVRGRHRVRLLVKADRGVPIQAAVADWLSQFKWPALTRVSVDIDPQSFL